MAEAIATLNDEIRVALEFARDRHKGQVRSRGLDIGLPYYDTHIVRVVAAVPEWARPAAALHDVVEDTPTTLDDLRRHGFSTVTVTAVGLLTRLGNETYMQYIDRIVNTGAPVQYQVARAVKLADLIDNLQGLTEGSLRLRYISALGCVAKAITLYGDKS